MNRPGRSAWLAFVFSSQGGQWPGMGIELARSDATFRDALQRCSVIIEDRLGISLPEILRGETGPADDKALVQPMVTAIQLALVETLAKRGAVAGAAIGLSMGEVAAAYAVRALTFEAAMEIACAGAIAVHGHAGSGGMAAVSAGRVRIEPLIADLPRVWVAVELSPTSTILSGREADLDEALNRCVARGIRFVPRTMPFAFHTPEMSEVRSRFLAEVLPVAPAPALVQFYSSVVGGPIQTTELVVDYWSRMFTEPAPFMAAVDAITSDGFDTFVEIGPHPILGAAVAEIARARDRGFVAVHAAMSRDDHGARMHELTQLLHLGMDSAP